MLTPTDARRKLLSATRLHLVHWLVIGLSLILSFGAWRFAKSTLDAQVQSRFDRESDQMIELVKDRMKNYADALRGGVAMIEASDGDVDFEQWEKYANSLHIETRFPGINGLGVIHALDENSVADYLDDQRAGRPEFQIHPPHDGNEYYPIGYIVPVVGNEKAVGLDMAHEENRFTAAKNSRDTGQAQITGPITLVQDNSKTPGFLFYAPFYDGGNYELEEDRKAHFSGLVYAPFVVKKLLKGVLEKEKRHVGVRLTDNGNVLYDEHIESESDFDPDPQFKRTTEISMYGRSWTLDIWSTRSFRDASSSSQPLLILVGGILIDGLLILFFVSISRSSRTALGYADSMTRQLEISKAELEASQLQIADRAIKLERSNAELEQFAYIASHDLQEPLRKVASFCELIDEEYGARLDDDGRQYLKFAIDGATRMRSLVQDLLKYSRVGSEQNRNNTLAESESALKSALNDLELAIEESNAVITSDRLPVVIAEERELAQLFQNLVGNAIKYRGTQTPVIHVGVESIDDDWQFSVRDNGIGIAPEFRERIFGIFKRLHSNNNYPGTGIGLAICKRIVDKLEGKIRVESTEGPGCTICFTIPRRDSLVSNLKTSQIIVLAPDYVAATNFAQAN